MSNKSTAAESIRRLAMQYKDMVEVADFLESAGSQETIVAEANKAAQEAIAERDAALVQLEQTKSDFAQLKADAADVVAKAVAKAKAIVEGGEADAAVALLQARNKAEEMLFNAQAAAAAMVNKAQSASDAFSAEVALRKQVLEDLEAKRVESEKAADAAQKKLEAVQATIRKLAED